jgi:hydrogenase maturation factor
LCAAEILEHNIELKAMHDVTEGGVVGAIIELAQASNCGFLIYDNKLPVGKTQKQIAELFNIDHRFSLGAGSMIIVVKNGTENKLVSKLKKRHIPAAVVGEITPESLGFKIQLNDKKEEVNFNGKDPYWDAFFNALNRNLK